MSDDHHIWLTTPVMTQIIWASNGTDQEDGMRPNYGAGRATVWSDAEYDKLADAIIRSAARKLWLEAEVQRKREERKAKREKRK